MKTPYSIFAGCLLKARFYDNQIGLIPLGMTLSLVNAAASAGKVALWVSPKQTNYAN